MWGSCHSVLFRIRRMRPSLPLLTVHTEFHDLPKDPTLFAEAVTHDRNRSSQLDVFGSKMWPWLVHEHHDVQRVFNVDETYMLPAKSQMARHDWLSSPRVIEYQRCKLRAPQRIACSGNSRAINSPVLFTVHMR